MYSYIKTGITTSIAASALLALALRADNVQPALTKQELMEQVFQLTCTPELIAQSLQTLMTQLSIPNDAQQDIVDRYYAVCKELSLSQYEQLFTYEELVHLHAFYSHPAGASMIAKIPQTQAVLQQAITRLLEMVQPYLPTSYTAGSCSITQDEEDTDSCACCQDCDCGDDCACDDDTRCNGDTCICNK